LERAGAKERLATAALDQYAIRLTFQYMFVFVDPFPSGAE
jgi:hypothetical protein